MEFSMLRFNQEKRKIRTLIVDDEPLARRNIWLLLNGDPDIEIVADVASGREALDVIKESAPDLMFLDIQMPEMSGFEMLANIGNAPIPVTVFVTAFDQFALNAFEVHAVDYLLKPFSDERFEKALRQAKCQVENLDVGKLGHSLFSLLADYQSTQSGGTQPTPKLKRIMVKSAGRIQFLNTEDIDWIGADDYYVQIHIGKKSYLIRETISDLERQLDPNMFVRVHRSSIVNITRIKELHPHFNGDFMVVLNDGTELKLSRSRREYVNSILIRGHQQ
jgi:two-component system LytT family response regulator